MPFQLNLQSFSFTIAILLSATGVFAQALTNRQTDSLAEKDLKLFNVPGMAVGIIKDGHLIYSKGFGVRSLPHQKAVDPETLFGIASNSKAFTAAALGILADEKKIGWDDKVTKYLPGFKLYDALASREITIRDLLCHRSGLGTGVGDLMHDPDSTAFSVDDIIYNLRYLKPDFSFRSRFAYDNNLYLVAGQVISKVSKMSFEDFIEKRILLPLEMNSSSASYYGASSNPNITSVHKLIGDSLRVVTRYTSMKDDAAGGIYSNITDMSKWLLMLMNKGRYGQKLDKQLLSAQTVDELLSPQIMIRTGPLDSYQTHFAAYGLGWFMNDERGYKLIFHSGSDVGMVSEVSMIPELNLGVIILSNNESTASYAVTDQIIDGYIGIKNQDRSAATFARFQAGWSAARRVRESIYKQASEQNLILHPIKKNYVGIYKDRWFGKVKITIRGNYLYFASERSPQLRGYLLAYKKDAFLVRWQNPELDADTFVLFSKGKSAWMQTVTLQSAGSDHSGTYKNLLFQRIN